MCSHLHKLSSRTTCNGGESIWVRAVEVPEEEEAVVLVAVAAEAVEVVVAEVEAPAVAEAAGAVAWAFFARVC